MGQEFQPETWDPGKTDDCSEDTSHQKTQVSKDGGLVLSPTRVSKRKIQAVRKVMFSLGVTCWRLLSHSTDTKLGSKTNPLKEAPEFSKRKVPPQLQLMLIIE